MPYADPEMKRAHARAYRAARREELARKQREYYQRTRPTREERNRQWLQEHPEIYRAIHFANRANQRARQQGIQGKIYARDLKHVVGPCAYCGGEALGWDHVVPLCQGGANDLANITPACDPCNRAKAGRTPEEWQAAKEAAG
jgi:5-methylcytosine-specific restriction endonuclease McrA